MVNLDVDFYTKTLNHRKILRKTQKINNLLKIKNIPKSKYDLSGVGPFLHLDFQGDMFPSAPSLVTPISMAFLNPLASPMILFSLTWHILDVNNDVRHVVRSQIITQRTQAGIVTVHTAGNCLHVAFSQREVILHDLLIARCAQYSSCEDVVPARLCFLTIQRETELLNAMIAHDTLAHISQCL